jgi:hypothetical protein
MRRMRCYLLTSVAAKAGSEPTLPPGPYPHARYLHPKGHGLQGLGPDRPRLPVAPLFPVARGLRFVLSNGVSCNPDPL